MKYIPNWKPKFTEEELLFFRSLPKKQREQEVKRLRAKYLKELE